MVLLEAFATGTPALVSALGGQSEMSDDERCALTFRAGDAAHLAERLSFALSRPDAMARLPSGPASALNNAMESSVITMNS